MTLNSHDAWRGGLLAALTTLPGALAQEPFGQPSSRALDVAVESRSGAAAADVDGDGDQDLLISSRGAQSRLYLNDGDGMFTDVSAAQLPATQAWVMAAEFVDADGDGDVDLVLAVSDVGSAAGGQNLLWLNDGSGRFTDATVGRLPGRSDPTVDVAAFDVDADGDQDLLWLGNGVGGNLNRVTSLMLNDGSGRFRDVSAAQLPAPVFSGTAGGISVGDLDGDGDPDFVTVVSSATNPVRVHRNDGSGRFTLLMGPSLPAVANPLGQPLLVDFEGDGDLDVLVGGSVAWSNDGTAVFVDETRLRLPEGIVYFTQAGDFDVDGDVDLLARTRVGERVLYNEGTGRFFRQGALVDGVALAFDADGDLDLDLLRGIEFDVLLNNGQGLFYDRLAAEQRLPSTALGLGRADAADVDGDGDLDLWCPSDRTGPELLINDGRGWFRSGSVARPLPSSQVVRFADVDADGDPDLVMGEHLLNASSRLFHNDGLGRFVDASVGNMPRAPGRTVDLEIADVDGDGDLDIVEANFGSTDHVLLNDGAGRFVLDGSFPSDGADSTAVTFADIDADGAPDLFFGSLDVPPRLYRNDGAGGFIDVSLGRLPVLPAATSDVVASDFDGDGDVDLFTSSAMAASVLLLNDGSGHFSDATAGRIPAALAGRRVHALDYDLDGDQDLLLYSGNDSILGENDGTGRFSLRQELTLLGPPVVVADVDQDTDPDFVVMRGFAAGSIVRNQLRQSWFGRPVRVGRTASLEVSVQSDPGSTTLLIPALSGGPARIELPVGGVLGLDPATVLTLPGVGVASGATRASVRFPVPADPNLLRARIYAQVLVLEPRAVQLTNAETTLVLH